jgi:phosphatidylinositol-3-phosphatase
VPGGGSLGTGAARRAHALAVLAAVGAIALLGTLTVPAFGAPAAAKAPAVPRLRHVFLILLENQAYGTTFGPGSTAAYLARTLPAQGALLTQYYAIAHNSLPNYIALVSGQPPTAATQADCPRYRDFELRSPALDAQGVALGEGCVYPPIVRTLPDELEAAGYSWKGYMEDMGKDPAREAAACAHASIGARDHLLEATPRDQYATKHNPFVYFHSIIDDEARCARHVVELGELERDLLHASTTPNFVFITPNLCHDGHDAPCVDGEPGGLVSADAFLRAWVPRILGSEAYRRDGLLIITFDESSALGTEAVAACCGETASPNSAYPPGLGGPGGGRIGAVVLSPRVRGGTVSSEPYNHYALLRTLAALFGVPPPGLAADPHLPTFGRDVFN